MNKLKVLTVCEQSQRIKKDFGVSVETKNGSTLVARLNIKPSPLGMLYKIKLTYSITDSPKVYITSPKVLKRFQNEKKLPHCYCSEQQWLCLYYPEKSEWNKSLFLSDTIIPWTMEWLFHYEIWVKTGVWTGGGVHRNLIELNKSKNIL